MSVANRETTDIISIVLLLSRVRTLSNRSTTSVTFGNRRRNSTGHIKGEPPVFKWYSNEPTCTSDALKFLRGQLKSSANNAIFVDTHNSPRYKYDWLHACQVISVPDCNNNMRAMKSQKQAQKPSKTNYHTG